MKRVKILVSILIICLIGMCYNVKAVGDTQKQDSELAAKCVYEYEHDENSKTTWYIYIDKKYTLSAYSSNVEYGTNFYNKILSSTFKFKYDKYLDKDKKLNCENIPILYVDYATNSKHNECRDFDGSCITYTFSPNKEDFSYDSFGSKKYSHDWEAKLVPSQSKVFIENSDKEVVDSGEWDLACHYGSYHLYYNYDTGEYKTNADNYNVDAKKYPSLAQNYKKAIQNLISENYNSCPTSYCNYTKTAGGFDYPVSYSFFSNKYEKEEGCYVSQQFAKEYSCGILSTSMELYDKYAEAQNKIELKRIENRIKDFCSNVYANLDYNDSTNCVKECLKAVDIIKTTNGSNVGECGFSARLMSFISNILRWIKYILPIIVIVLGILDFIKAIGADKDDEIKKAQGKFIKRLIAAALVFIVPLILEFVLDKMGFGYDDCGLF